MTIRDLVSGADGDLEGMEIVVREGGKGRWIQGYRISKKAELYPIDSTIENRELYPWVKTNSHGDYCCDVPEGETLVVHQPFRDFPIKIMCIDPKKAPKEINIIRVTFMLFITLASFCGTSLNKRFSISLLLSRQTNNTLVRNSFGWEYFVCFFLQFFLYKCNFIKIFLFPHICSVSILR